MGIGTSFGKKLLRNALHQTNSIKRLGLSPTARASGSMIEGTAGFSDRAITRGLHSSAIKERVAKIAQDLDDSMPYTGIAVHGSTQSGLKEISPMLSDATKGAGYVDKPSVFMWDPTRMKDEFQVGNAASDFAFGGSYYITKANNAKRLKGLPHVLASEKSVEVLEEIPNTGRIADLQKLDEAIERHGLKRHKPVSFVDEPEEMWS